MRSRIMNAPRERLIIYGFDDDTAEKFKGTAQRMHTELCVLSPESAREQVGYLAGFAGFSAKDPLPDNPDPDPRQCVIFSCMDGKKLSRTVDDVRANGLGGIPLKAAVTSVNQKMTLSELMDELEKEHRIMHKGEDR